ncbi:MAG: TIGR03032 family protein [Planctomycetaceae bacterium]|nr:TIGR03032 family protein [Planctomycetaceae bacterium]
MSLMDDNAERTSDLPPLRSSHTASFPALLNHLGVSVFVTTYQAGKLVMLRAEGETLNTHFRGFSSPMGLAVDEHRLAVGSPGQVCLFQNVPAVGHRLAPEGSRDACFLPRSSHVTGNILVHEMAWSGDDLWIVNTRFSCLCTLDRYHSFVPRWKPPFVTALAPEDRCHLNGIGLCEGRPRFVTALGRTDSPSGWRSEKATGGILLDVTTNEILANGLSMPHSPRWNHGRLWLLESGAGKVGTVDLQTGRFETVAVLPGFTRGLDFFGDYAFIGLSQVRETAVFSGIEITNRLSERACGVWVLNIVTGQTVAFVKFEDAVQEIFAVQVLPGVRSPDVINDDDALIQDSFVLPDNALGDVPASLKYPSN